VPSEAPRFIQLTGVSKSLRSRAGPIRAVRGIDLTIGRGETVALLGPNGAGKSTTIAMLLGLLRPDRGTLMIDGLQPADAIGAGLVGAMLQGGSLIRDVSVRELVTMFAGLYRDPADVSEVLGTARIQDLADRRTQKLSGGQAQRVRFALALVSDPELVVLDEPTVGMDVESRRAFWQAMRGLAARGRTVLFATHDLGEADAYADRVVLMAGGLMTADGAPSELRGRVGRRTIRARLGSDDGIADLRSLRGVEEVGRRGDFVVLSCSDSDAAVRDLLAARPLASEIEITGAGLEEAFVELTSGGGS
jgi:ABC-2 type transport system ATP-binding protein